MISGLPLGRYAIFAVIVLLYIILGMFTDIIASVVITIPVIYPVILALGFDPIWFGVVVVILMEMGMITPPIGMNVFVLAGMIDVPVGTIFRGVWPFVLAELFCIVIITIIPEIALFIPNLM
jgi:TRAP-type C4-dicarboxylate transport system permease large subunit